MMVDFLLGMTILMSLAVAALAAASWFAGKQYDAWVKEFEHNGGVKAALEPVLHGPDVVGYAVVVERRANRL